MFTDDLASKITVLGLALLGATAAIGCASTSITPDLARVKDLSRAAALPPVDRDGVSDQMAAEIQGLLRQPIGVETAVKIALANNRPLRAALRDIGIVRGNAVQAGLLPNPEVEFDIREPHTTGQPIQLDFLVEFDLTRALLAPARASAAGADVRAAQFQVAAAVVELGFSVRSAFYALQAAEERLALTNMALDTFAAGKDAATALNDAGNMPDLEKVTRDAAYQSARATAAEMELVVLTRREALTRLLGLSGEATSWTVAGRLAPPPEKIEVPDALERKAIEASLELKEVQQKLEAMARRTGLVRAEGLLPDVTVDWHAEQDGTSWEVGGGAKISLPIFDRQQGRLAAQEAELDGWMERYHAAAIDIRSAARETRNSYTSAHLRARHYVNVIVPARKAVVQQVILQYNAMQVGIFQLLEAKRQVLDAEMASVETLREMWTAKAALDALLAGKRVGMGTMTGATTTMTAGSSEGGH